MTATTTTVTTAEMTATSNVNKHKWKPQMNNKSEVKEHMKWMAQQVNNGNGHTKKWRSATEKQKNKTMMMNSNIIVFAFKMMQRCNSTVKVRADLKFKLNFQCWKWHPAQCQWSDCDPWSIAEVHKVQTEVGLAACEADKSSLLTVSVSLTVVLDCVEKVLVCCQFVLLCCSVLRTHSAGVFCAHLWNSFSDLSFDISLTFNGLLVLISWSFKDGVKMCFSNIVQWDQK